MERTSAGMGVGEATLSPVKEGEYDRRTEYDFWRGLGVRLGQEEFWPWKDIEEAHNYEVSPEGYTLRELMEKTGGLPTRRPGEKRYEQNGFGTPTGKVELYSTILGKLGHDPLPYYEEPVESHISTLELAKEYPLILITGGRFLPMYHSEWRQVVSARKAHPDPITNPSGNGLRIGDKGWGLGMD